MTQNDVCIFWKNTPYLNWFDAEFFGFVTCSWLGGLSLSGNHVFKEFDVEWLILVSRSSFNSQPFGAFTASAKIKRGFLLRLLQALSGLYGLFQLFIIGPPFIPPIGRFLKSGYSLT
ncbi:hypothetical protein HCJ07_08270 [Listeria booriae]|uniref:hypothetical protein n=1 Tax=Listeria booriae TaxID=1552123 RepID=UPI0016294AB7|nr:hypothetical protein [Listeria booriae]MBC1530343.1 hypothetical protein [Listeria booriae]